MNQIEYPFSALVGQADMRTALLLNAVNPAIGGVLIRGEKGTAKSTAVRGIAALLPQIEVVAGCPLPFAPSDCPNARSRRRAAGNPLAHERLVHPRRRIRGIPGVSMGHPPGAPAPRRRGECQSRGTRSTNRRVRSIGAAGSLCSDAVAEQRRIETSQ